MTGENLRVGRKSSQPTEGRDELGGVATREIGTAIASTEKCVAGEEKRGLVYGVRCRVYGGGCRVYSVRCTVYGGGCTVYSVRCRGDVETDGAGGMAGGGQKLKVES